MIPKRVKQFYMNVTDIMKKEDYDYVAEILNKKELSLFTKLLKSEQKHCVRIAKDIEYIIDNKEINNIEIIKNKDRLIKVSLLHDIGKTRKKLNVIDKSIIVILNKLTKGELIKFEKSKKIQCYYKHSEYSYEILKDMIDDNLILDVARNHHKDNVNEIVNFFKVIDDKN
ncbi:HD domain-containing protein [[Clostridium] dakarense]|uniref:HD domain-containing protein n=1 Tax=Faecalimicrobium dakarense TaxID=1301100 RepID=UPI0004B9FAE4|nr:HD domain-containing protein [[Clostridium] dakarense]